MSQNDKTERAKVVRERWDRLLANPIPGSLTPVLRPDTLYSGDNGRILCGCCSGMSATYSGRDISGQKVAAIGPAYAREFFAMGDEFPLQCEDCCHPYGAKRGVSKKKGRTK